MENIAEQIELRINELNIVPFVNKHFSFFPSDLVNIVKRYLVAEPLHLMISRNNIANFKVKEFQDTRFKKCFPSYADADGSPKINSNLLLKFSCKDILLEPQTNININMQILHMFGSVNYRHDEKDRLFMKEESIYPCKLMCRDELFGLKFLIPKNLIFDYFIKFLQWDGKNISKNQIHNNKFKLIGKNFMKYVHKFNPFNHSCWGNADIGLWHFKVWIIHFLFDITNHFLFTTDEYKQPEPDNILEDIKETEKSNEIPYPWPGYYLLDHSFSFPIQWERETCEYFIGVYRDEKFQINEKKNKKSHSQQFIHYYIQITNNAKQKPLWEALRYIRGSIVPVNPVSTLIFFLLTRNDDELMKLLGSSIPIALFRRLLIQRITLIHDWN